MMRLSESVRCMTDLGIRKIKLTGGEPLTRKGCATLVQMLKGLDGINKVTLTTNGVLLKDQIRSLFEAGIDDINISLDTLDASRFAQVTRRESLNQVLEGIEAALPVPGNWTKDQLCASAGGAGESGCGSRAGETVSDPCTVY